MMYSKEKVANMIRKAKRDTWKEAANLIDEHENHMLNLGLEITANHVRTLAAIFRTRAKNVQVEESEKPEEGNKDVIANPSPVIRLLENHGIQLEITEDNGHPPSD